MLDVLNRYAHGFVVVPVVLACRQGRLFEALEEQAARPADLCVRLGANRGHLRVTLRLLESLGWIDADAEGYVRATARLHEQNLIPDNVRPLIDADMDAWLRAGSGGFLRPYVERSKARWHLENDLIADFLDSLMVVPILGLLAKRKMLEQSPASGFSGLPAGVREEIIDFLRHLKWLDGEAGRFELTPAGAFMFERAMNLGLAESYRPMLGAMPELLFGNAAAVFARGPEGHETHVDRTLNVIASGFMHDRFFTEVEDILISLFSREPLSEQPRYIADMGSGDGTFLKHVFATVRDKTPRGKMLDRYPLTMIGIDFNQASLEETRRTLADIDHVVVTGDIGDPAQLIRNLEALGIDCDEVLHIRSFLDHDRPYKLPSDKKALEARSGARYLGAYADLQGDEIRPAEAVQSLVEHLGRWAEVVNKHGLILLEVHCQDPLVLRSYLDQSESLYFDAIEGYSQQLLVEADVALMAAAEVGLFPGRAEFRKFPNVLPYCRITLNRLERRPYRVRMARNDDLPTLLQLEEACWAPPMRVSADEILRRIQSYPLGQWVLEMDDRILAVVYSQRIHDIDMLHGCRFETVHKLHDNKGSAIQLLAINVLPDVQQLGLGDQLLDLMLLRSSVQGGVQRVTGLTRCRNFSGSSIEQLRHYVAERDADGRPSDPILRFHASHGARMIEVVPGYRPEDVENLGTGTLICYDLGSTHPAAGGTGSAVPGAAAVRTGDRRTRLETSLRTILGPKRQAAFSWQKTMRDVGLDSLDLLEFRTLLQNAFDRPLSPTFFFAHPTLDDIDRFFTAAHAETPKGSGRPQPERIRLTPPPFAPCAIPAASPANAPAPDHTKPAVAIIGMAGMFPGCADIDEYWELLHDGRDAIREIPADRWHVDDYYSADPDAPGKIVSRFGGFLDGVDQFDAAFFNIAPSEARLMDPQQRKLLEVHWEALENAGIDPNSLKEAACGLFVGLYSHDYELLQMAAGDENDLGAYYATGSAGSIAAGRIAYFLGTRGPALTIDTACSSSLVAVHQALRSLRSGETDLAIASGVNLLLSPRLSIAFSKAGMLSPGGRCRTFDAGADGYVRSEACAAVVLKRLDEALRDGDEVLAVLRGSAINQDGASNGLTAPSLPAQQALLRSALRDAGLAPSDIAYLEAHGTGTNLGDPIEFAALSDVFGADSERSAPLWVGSAKTNIGHAEAAAGIAGLVKVVLALQHRTLPRHLHFEQANPHIDLEFLPARIPLETVPWDAVGKPLRAGVSSFGFSGTNAHVIVEEAPESPASASSPVAAPLQILPLSARTDTALRAVMTRYADWLESDTTGDLTTLCRTAACGRAHFGPRRAVTGASAGELARQLRGALQNMQNNAPKGEPLRIAFLFTGQGSQYVDMARDLAASEPTFRDALARCCRILEGELDTPLEDILYPSDSGNSGRDAAIDNTAYTQPALFALEYALARMLQHWGIEPAALIGHSVGEYVAACIAGVFSLEDGLRLIAARGRLMGSLPVGGAMAAVLGANECAAALAERSGGSLSIAAVNGPANIVISGAASSVQRATAELEQAGIKVVPLNVSHAFHSSLMDPIAPAFSEVLRWVKFAEPRLPIASNVTGRYAGADIATADYWAKHLRHAVRFADGIGTLLDDGVNVMLEVGPHPVLTAMGHAVATERQDGTDRRVAWLHSLARERSGWECAAECVAALYEKGLDPDWAGLYGAGPKPRVRLPNYPWQRKSYWFEERNDGRRNTEKILFEPRWSVRGRLDDATAGRTAAGLPDAKSIAGSLLEIRDRARSVYPDSPVGRELDEECRNLVIAALRRVGWAPSPGDSVSARSLLGNLGLLPKYERLLHRLFQMLAEDGLLKTNGTGFTVAGELPPGGNRMADLIARYPECRNELSLLGHCVADLDGVLRGTVDPLDLIFPGGDMTTAEAVYTNAPFAKAGNEIVVAAIHSIVSTRTGGAPLRILEIGAGTGGTTASILPLLPTDTDYVFTDLSPAFLDRAQTRFRDYPFARYELFDIEQPPASQGFAAHQFDVVIAANVLHATVDLTRSVQHASELLAGNGLLLLVEGLEPARWVDLVFGLTDGWWRFTDTALRPDYPLLREARWRELLHDRGFKASELVGTSNPEQIGRSPVDLLNQGVILAQAGPREPREIAAGLRPSNRGRWIVLSDRGGVGQRFAEIAGECGDECELVEATPVHEGAPADREWNGRLRDLLAGKGHGTLPARIIDLRPLDLAPNPVDGQALVDSAINAGMDVVEIVRTLADAGHPPLCLVTRQGQSVRTAEATAPVAATIWGLGNVVAAEYPNLDLRLIDLDSTATAADAGLALYREAASDAGDRRAAFRGGQRFVPFFSPVAPADQRLECDPEGVYLITGGMGELGLLTARWLAQQGARNFVLVGRTPFPDSDAWAHYRKDPLLAPRIGIVEDLLRLGVRPQFLTVDISDRQAVDSLIERIHRIGPVRGLVQAAAVVLDRRIDQLTADDYRQVLEPKIAGSWNLLQALRDEPLGFCVFYSSIGSMIGLPGQAGYAAANAFMDALASSGDRQGPALRSINWCVWRGTGLARSAGGQRASAELESRGIADVSIDDATALLGQAIVSGTRQVATVPLARTTAVRAGEPDPLLANLRLRYRRDSDVQPARPAKTGFRSTLTGLQGSELMERLEQLVVSTIAELLDIRVTAVNLDHSLGDMGMDSLLSLEFHKLIQRQFDVHLPATLAWNYPTARTLVARVVSLVTGETTPAASDGESASIPDQGTLQSADLLDDLSDDDALRQLMGSS